MSSLECKWSNPYRPNSREECELALRYLEEKVQQVKEKYDCAEEGRDRELLRREGLEWANQYMSWLAIMNKKFY